MMLQELSLRLSAMLPVTFWWHVLCWPASAAVEALCWMLRRPHAALQKVKKQQVPWNGARDAPQSSCFLLIIPWGDIVAGCPCTQAQAARKLFTALNNRVSRHTFLLIASQHSCAWQNLKSNHPAIHPGSASCNMIPVMLRKSLLQDTALVLCSHLLSSWEELQAEDTFKSSDVTPSHNNKRKADGRECRHGR